ncbi:MAG: hypothetical protein JXR64_13730 [Spirochaetales bacterium]|nr:hypothetical protein [Spirochaetales bacterium]
MNVNLAKIGDDIEFKYGNRIVKETISNITNKIGTSIKGFEYNCPGYTGFVRFDEVIYLWIKQDEGTMKRYVINEALL